MFLIQHKYHILVISKLPFVSVKTIHNLFIPLEGLNLNLVLDFNIFGAWEIHDEILNDIIHTCILDSFIANWVEMDFWKQGLPSEIFCAFT